MQKYASTEKSPTFCNTNQSSSNSANTATPTTANTAASAAAAAVMNNADEDFYLSYKMCPSVAASQSWPYEVEFDKYVKKRNYCSNNSTTTTAAVNRMANAMISTTTSKASPSAKKQLPSSLSRATADTERVQSTQSNSSLKNILNLNTKSFPMKSLFLNNCNIVYSYDPAKQEASNNKSGRRCLPSPLSPSPSLPPRFCSYTVY